MKLFCCVLLMMILLATCVTAAPELGNNTIRLMDPSLLNGSTGCIQVQGSTTFNCGSFAAARDAAADGDEFWIDQSFRLAGQYTLANKSLVLTSRGAEVSCVSSPISFAWVFVIKDVDSSFVVANFHLRDCYGVSGIVGFQLFNTNNTMFTNVSIENFRGAPNAINGIAVLFSNATGVLFQNTSFVRCDKAIWAPRAAPATISPSLKWIGGRCEACGTNSSLDATLFWGGCVLWHSRLGSLELDGVDFIGNAAFAGGYVMNMQIIFMAINLTLKSGAVAIGVSNDTSIRNCLFEDNFSFLHYGGALSVHDSSLYAKVNNCTFRNNEAVNGGGAFFGAYYVSIRNSLFEANRARRGGGVFVDEPVTDLLLESSTFINNSVGKIFEGTGVGGIGGGVFVTNRLSSIVGATSAAGALRVVASSFSLNKAEVAGGALMVNHSLKMTIDECEFEANEAARGGALAVEGADLRCQQTLLRQNKATADAAALFCGSIIVTQKTESRVTFDDVVVELGDGGECGACATAEAVVLSDLSSFVLKRSSVTSNSSSSLPIIAFAQAADVNGFLLVSNQSCVCSLLAPASSTIGCNAESSSPSVRLDYPSFATIDGSCKAKVDELCGIGACRCNASATTCNFSHWPQPPPFSSSSSSFASSSIFNDPIFLAFMGASAFLLVAMIMFFIFCISRRRSNDNKRKKSSSRRASQVVGSRRRTPTHSRRTSNRFNPIAPPPGTTYQPLSIPSNNNNNTYNNSSNNSSSHEYYQPAHPQMDVNTRGSEYTQLQRFSRPIHQQQQQQQKPPPPPVPMPPPFFRDSYESTDQYSAIPLGVINEFNEY